jgi:hypothetical protein
MQHFLGISGMEGFLRRVHHDGIARSQIAAMAPSVVAAATTGDEDLCI